jgi:hypothetical protein
MISCNLILSYDLQGVSFNSVIVYVSAFILCIKLYSYLSQIENLVCFSHSVVYIIKREERKRQGQK